MNDTEKQFIDILSKSIRNNMVIINYDYINWEELFCICKKNNVEDFLYSILNGDDKISNVDKKFFIKVKKSIGNRAIENMLINDLLEIFKKLNCLNISFRVLNGLVFRNFYPKSGVRNINDASILVNESDIEKVKEVFKNYGFKILEANKQTNKMILCNKVGQNIEINCCLFKRDEFTDEVNNFERKIWKKNIKVKLEEAEVLSLSYEDLALYLCMQIAEDLSKDGLKLRRILDFIVLVESKGEEINWDSFSMKASMYRLEKLSKIIMIICNNLLKMKIPKAISFKAVNNKKYIDALIKEIFKVEINENLDMIQNCVNQEKLKIKNNKSKFIKDKLTKLLKLVFPSVEELPDKYDYAKEYKYLLPLAWINYLLIRMFNKKYSLKEKIKFINTEVNVSVDKSKLLEWMEL